MIYGNNLIVGYTPTQSKKIELSCIFQFEGGTPTGREDSSQMDECSFVRS